MGKKDTINPIEEEITANFLDMVQPLETERRNHAELEGATIIEILSRLNHLEETLASTREIMRLQAEQIRALRSSRQ